MCYNSIKEVYICISCISKFSKCKFLKSHLHKSFNQNPEKEATRPLCTSEGESKMASSAFLS